MDSAHAGSLWIHAQEPVVRGHDTLLALRLRAPADGERLGAAWERQVRARPALRLRWVEDAAARRFRWVPFSESDLATRVASARAALRTLAPEAALGEYVPSGEGLVHRWLLRDDRTLVARSCHLFTNLLGQACWMEDGLRVDSGGAEAAPFPERIVAPPSAIDRWVVAAAGVARALAFAARFRRAAGRDAGAETVDLTDGRSVAEQSAGATVHRLALGPGASRALLESSRARGLTVTARVVAETARALLDARPGKRRVLVGLPVDLVARLGSRSRSAPGNPTAGFVIQCFRGGDLDAEAREGLAEARRGTAFWLARAMDAPARDERKLLDAFAARARLPIPERAPFENLSCVVSSVALPESLTALAAHCEAASFHTWAQVPLVTVCSLAGATTLAVTSPDDRVAPADAASLFERLAAAVDPAGSGTRDAFRLVP